MGKKKGGHKKQRWTFRSVLSLGIAVVPPAVTAVAGNTHGVDGALGMWNKTHDFGKALQEFSDVMSIEYSFYKPSDGSFWMPGQMGIGGLGLLSGAAGGFTYKTLTWVKNHTGLRHVKWF